MTEWEAPAKLNLDLRLDAPDSTGRHPLRSLVQAIDWLDILVVEEGEEDVLEVTGADLPTEEDNLVWKAVEALHLSARPRLHIRLDKRVPVAAGLGGGSSDAAAAVRAVAELVGLGGDRVGEAAAAVGADVPFFLVGGTAWMGGHGERVTPGDPLEGFAVGVVVPPFELVTADVYRRWDALDAPTGDEKPVGLLPPAMRRYGEMRNDLTAAAVDLVPELGDWVGELERGWSRPVFMSGSGPACFAYFIDLDEAASAVSGLRGHRGAQAALPRPAGVRRRE